MIRPLALLLLAAPFAAGGQPAPVVSVQAAPLPPLSIASFRSGPVRCGNAERAPVRFVAPLAAAVRVAEPEGPIRFRFRIDNEGRPLSIRQIGDPVSARLDVRDLAPALTAWRFTTGRQALDCEVAFTVRLDSVETADEALLYRYAALGAMQISGGRALVRPAFARLQPAGSTCQADPVPREPINLQPLTIPEVPGGISYSFFGYDVDAQGRPVHIRLLSSSGNRALDTRGDLVLGRARFPLEPRTGCLYYFFRNNTESAPAPPAPPASDFRPEQARCAEGVPRLVRERIRMQYPIEFTRRPADGWVIFTYDVAATGELRDVRIAASEPAARFGEEVLRAAAEVRLDDVAVARRGCVQRVRFIMAPAPGAPPRRPNRRDP
jgi:hypothetical protein